MTRTVYKTVLPVADRVSLLLPEGAELLTAREQREDLCIWYRCDPDAPKIRREIIVCDTGCPAPDGRYIGTAFFRGDSLVFHVFEGA